ncbi:hypothetical protein CR513_62782, partial [Mucuna pruriens]
YGVKSCISIELASAYEVKLCLILLLECSFCLWNVIGQLLGFAGSASGFEFVERFMCMYKMLMAERALSE